MAEEQLEENLSDIEVRRRRVAKLFDDDPDSLSSSDLDFYLEQYWKGEIPCRDEEKLKKLLDKKIKNTTEEKGATVINQSMNYAFSTASGYASVFQNNYSELDRIADEIQKFETRTGTDQLIIKANKAVLDKKLIDRNKDNGEILGELYTARQKASRKQRKKIDKALKNLDPEYWEKKKAHASSWNPKKWSGYFATRAFIRKSVAPKLSKLMRRDFNKEFERVKKAIELRQEYAQTKWFSTKFLHKASMKMRMTLSSSQIKFNRLVNLADEAGLERIQNEIIAPNQEKLKMPVYTKLQQNALDKTALLIGSLEEKVGSRGTKIKDQYKAEESQINSYTPNEKKIQKLQERLDKNLKNRVKHSREDTLDALKGSLAYKVAKKLGIDVEKEYIEKAITEDKLMQEIISKMPDSEDEKRAILKAIGWEMDENGDVSRKAEEENKEENKEDSEDNIEEDNKTKEGPEFSHHKEENGEFVADEDSNGLYKYDEVSNHYTLKPEKLTKEEDVKKILDLAQDGKLTLIAADFDPDELALVQKVATEDEKYKGVEVIAQLADGSKEKFDEKIIEQRQKEEEEKTAKEQEVKAQQAEADRIQQEKIAEVIGQVVENTQRGNDEKSKAEASKGYTDALASAMKSVEPNKQMDVYQFVSGIEKGQYNELSVKEFQDQMAKHGIDPKSEAGMFFGNMAAAVALDAEVKKDESLSLDKKKDLSKEIEKDKKNAGYKKEDASKFQRKDVQMETVTELIKSNKSIEELKDDPAYKLLPKYAQDGIVAVRKIEASKELTDKQKSKATGQILGQVIAGKYKSKSRKKENKNRDKSQSNSNVTTAKVAEAKQATY